VTLAAVYDASGRLVEWAGDQPHRAADRVPETLELQPDGITFGGAVPVAGSGPRLSFLAPLELDGAVEGTLLVELTGAELARLAARYDEFGETGEALVVTRTGPQTASVLHPVRHALDTVLSIQLGDPSEDPFAGALMAAAEAVWVDVTDYRGEAVWVASRSLPETGWGLVVKVDKAQEEAPIVEFRGRLARVGLSLSAFAILLATVLGLRFAKPIQDLAGVASEIRDGRMSARAREDREDEVGLLARTFNEMATELERRMASLQEFKKFFDVSLDMLCVAGTDGFFKRTNPSFGRVLGWSDEELLQRPFLDIVHPDDIEATRMEIQKLSQGIPTVSFVNRFQCADGTYKHLLWTSYPEPETGLLYAIAHEVVDRSDERS